ncbi:hypothetical protein N4P33_03400 [Streptomyces sp. 15-116A]|uniref:Flp family type IVb pilin n=1 Tax=Streptomyces sp. 15-116A TaxID=2259035 RepID=UPI0021B29C7C|nr:hypothetical protein [Streptomyces sp. 15-116A]MCT7351216.1 hypothetical protein [Streptomyces sp. 15-116A]
MAAAGGAGGIAADGAGGVPPSGSSGRRAAAPRPLSLALILVHLLFAVTVIGGLGLLLTASSYDAVDGAVLALVAYAAAPGTLGWWLARRTRQGGGQRTWAALIAVQAWLILGSISNLADGSARGATQLLLPALIVYFLTRRETRDWYRLPDADRAPHRPFSLARMIRWRRDEGQTAVEYAGLIAVVAAIITALVVSGLGTQIFTGLQSQICRVTGTACPAPTGGDGQVNAGDGDGGADQDREGNGNDAGAGNEGGNGNGNGAGTGNEGNDPTDATDPGEEANGEEANGEDGTSDDDNGSESEEAADGEGPGDGQGAGDGEGPGDGQAAGDGEETRADGDDDGCFSGVGAFFGCAGDQLKQVGEGLFVDGIWGDLTDTWDTITNPLDSLKGLKDYGGLIADQWSEDAKDAGDKWAKGDYLDALTDWGGATLNSGGKILDDMFIGDEVRDQWNQGNKTRATTTVLWNVGSLFIPGYGEVKIVQKLGKLGKLGKLTDKAADAAEDARKAAKAGDAEGAREAAEKADEAADEAERKAREAGCTIAAPSRRIPYGESPAPFGGPGTGTTILAAASTGSRSIVLAEDGCDEEAKQEAQEARRQADDADKAADEAEQKKRPAAEWQARDDIAGPARGKLLKFPNKRHTISGASGGQVKERNTVILRGNEDHVRADIEGIADGRATLAPDGNTYEINGRSYEVEPNGTVFPKSGPGLVQLDRIEYAALKEIARNKGDTGASQQLQRDPKFVNNPEKVEKAKQIYDGTYK